MLLFLLAAQGLAQLPLDRTAPLLQGRLSVQVPKAMNEEARGAPNIMAAPPGTEHETRLVLDKGKARLVLFAEDLFATRNGDFLAQVKGDLAGSPDPEAAGAALSALVASSSFSAVEWTPAHFPPPKDDEQGTWLGSAFTATADGLVERVGLFANTAALGKDGKDVAQLAHRILATAAAGSAKVDRGPSTRDTGYARNGHKLVFHLPKDVLLETNQGIDFLVYYFHPLKPLGTHGGIVGCYFGGFPSYHANPKAPAEKGHLFGEEVRWQRKSEDGRTVLETLVQAHLPQKADSLQDYSPYIHVFATAEDPAALEDLKHLAETIFQAEP